MRSTHTAPNNSVTVQSAPGLPPHRAANKLHGEVRIQRDIGVLFVEVPAGRFIVDDPIAALEVVRLAFDTPDGETPPTYKQSAAKMRAEIPGKLVRNDNTDTTPNDTQLIALATGLIEWGESVGKGFAPTPT